MTRSNPGPLRRSLNAAYGGPKPAFEMQRGEEGNMGEMLKAAYLNAPEPMWVEGVNVMSARDLRDALVLGMNNLPALPEEARAKVRERLGAMAERLRRIEATDARIRYENKLLAGNGTVEAQPYPVRWIATWVCGPGVCCMVGPCDARNTWESEAEARAWVDVARTNPETAMIYGDIDVRPVPCYPGTLEPTQCVFRLEAPNA